jgi:hypothetical protein
MLATLPDIDTALMVLMGLGHSAYLGKKLILTTSPAINQLAGMETATCSKPSSDFR